MFQNNLSLKRYKRVRTKYSTQINEEVFDPNDFITEMKPFLMIESVSTKPIQANKMRSIEDLNQTQRL